MNHYFKELGRKLQVTLVPLGRYANPSDDIAVGCGETKEEADAALLKSIEERCVVDFGQLNQNL